MWPEVAEVFRVSALWPPRPSEGKRGPVSEVVALVDFAGLCEG